MVCDIKPGDWVELKSGRRGMALATCYFAGVCIGVEVGFDWFDTDEVVVWKPQ